MGTEGICSLMRSLVVMACLLFGLPLKGVSFLASRLLSVRKLTCCNATREFFFKFDRMLQLRGS